MRKYYKLGTSDYEFVAVHSTYTVFVKDKDGKLVKRVNENGVLERVVKGLETVTTEYVTELFNNPNMYLRDTEGRSLAVMEQNEDDIFFRGFVSFDEQSDSAYKFKLTMDQHAKDVLASAKEGISFVKESQEHQLKDHEIQY